MSRRTQRSALRPPRRLALAAGAVILAITGGVVVATQVGASADAGRVAPNATLCTAPVRADAGVVLSGSSSINSGAGPLWSVRVSSSASGPETEVMRTPAHRLPPTSVVPPASGSWFFRGCLRNTGPLATTVQIQLTPIEEAAR
jgi:hypothetical protein